MTKGYDNSKDLIFWHKKFLAVVGVWPLQESPSLFYTWLIYITIHLCLMIIDLVQIIDNLPLVIGNLNATALLVMVMAKMLTLYYSTALRQFMRKVASNENKIDYNNEDEREVYMSYTRNVKIYFIYMLSLTGIATTLFFFKNLQFDFGNLVLEDFLVSPLPYRIWVFFNVTDKRNYVLACVCQGPMVYVFTCQTITTVFIWTLIIDSCGKLSVLSFRIRNVKCDPSESDDSIVSAFRSIVEAHKTIIWSVRAIEQAFNFALLVESVVFTVCMGLCIYNMIVNSDFSDFTEFLSFLLYVVTIMLCMFGSCLVGDLLSQESLKIRDSYYQIDWYNMSPRCTKMIIMCMTRTRIPLHITGGGFYIYSLESFTGVCKTGMAYGSMLRQSV